MHKLSGIYPLQQILYRNPPVREAPLPVEPTVSLNAVVAANSIVIGDVTVEDDVFIGFHTVIRADASPPYYIGPRTNIQDFAMIHAHPGEFVEWEGRRYGVYIESDVSILHHGSLHGPLFVGRGTFVGLRVSISAATIGRHCVVMHGAVVADGVRIADNRFVEPGRTVWTQEQADALPEVPERYKTLNADIVDYYCRLGKAYKASTPLAF
ncbi:hypothetical protein [Paenibacillus flagellatus]|nr:hypothetical protein [Paenibacillus flagellatus]